MESFIVENGITLLATVLLGGVIGWLLHTTTARHRVRQLNDDWQLQIDGVVVRRDQLSDEIGKLRTTIEAQEAVVHQRDMLVTKSQTALKSALEKEKLLAKNIFTLKAEREDSKNKVLNFQNALNSLKAQSDEMQVEFIKSGDFYKNELTKSFQKRKDAEEKYENAKLEYESFRNLLQSSRSEHDSVTKMLASAKTRLADLDALEHKVIELEAENAELKHSTAIARQDNDVLRRDVLELEELKVQNKELAQVLRSMESSRKQYEDDAIRYRQHAGKFEEKSETLKVRLDEVEQNFLAMEKQQREALREAREISSTQAANDTSAMNDEIDNLQDIVGIGKVFEHTLHSLGIVNFRQIASFGVSDIARVNAELREFKGRMEQDDWIGQAKELHFKKYGQTG